MIKFYIRLSKNMALNCLVSTSLGDESSMRDFIGGKTTFKDAGGSKIVARNRSSEGSGNKSLVWQRYFLRTPNPRKKMQPHKV